jgi:tetrapyrrole methylase family protein/MazG family protein
MILKDKNQIVAEKKHDFESLVSVVYVLRSKEGCPWDREQTHESIRRCLIEEAYEVVEAIDNKDSELLREELGDLIFQAVFHAQIESEEGRFIIEDVVSDICDKMIGRHPHVFGNKSVRNADEVPLSWDTIKKEEKSKKGKSATVFNAPPGLPSLIKAQKFQSKARKNFGVGFQSKEEAVAYAMAHIDDIPKAVFALSAAADFDGVDIEKALDDELKNFVSHISEENL